MHSPSIRRRAGWVGALTCSDNDMMVPLGNNVEYVVIGFSSKQQGDRPIRAARTMVFVKTWP